MNRKCFLYSFEFKDESIVNEDIDAVCAIDFEFFVGDGEKYFRSAF